MKLTWPHKDLSAFEVPPTVDAEAGGKILVNLTQNSLVEPKPYRMMTVTELDGPTRTALLDPSPNPKGYIFNNSTTLMGLRHGRYILDVYDAGKNDNVDETVLGGAVDDLVPQVLWSSSTSDGHAIGTSDTIWGTHDSYEIDLATMGGPLTTIFNGGQVGGLQQTKLYFWHDLAWWHSGNLNVSNVMAYTPKKGVYPFITFNNDTSQGAHGIGTDGNLIVWVYSHGRKPGDIVYPIRDIMVSPFTTDPALLKPKRLRSFPSTYSVITPFAVGCGYAAHSNATGQALVVRLSDGVSWPLPNDGCQGPLPTKWCWDTVSAVTCDEVILLGGYAPQTIARVRLDALGPGIQPD